MFIFLFSRRYKHFLQDMAANTSPDNPEFQQLSSTFLLRFLRSSDNHFDSQIHPERSYCGKGASLVLARAQMCTCELQTPRLMLSPPSALVGIIGVLQ